MASSESIEPPENPSDTPRPIKIEEVLTEVKPLLSLATIAQVAASPADLPATMNLPQLLPQPESRPDNADETAPRNTAVSNWQPALTAQDQVSIAQGNMRTSTGSNDAAQASPFEPLVLPSKEKRAPEFHIRPSGGKRRKVSDSRITQSIPMLPEEDCVSPSSASGQSMPLETTPSDMRSNSAPRTPQLSTPLTISGTQLKMLPVPPSDILTHALTSANSQRATSISLMPYRQIVLNYMSSNAVSPTSHVEHPRFILLLDACAAEDFFYIALHQMYCLHAYSPEAAVLQGIRSDAFAILGRLILDNSIIPRHRLEWFANFPSNIEVLADKSAVYRTATQAVFRFLRLLPQNWHRLLSYCHLRNYPPLVSELCQEIHLISPTLQRIFFTAARRALWSFREDRVAENIFVKNQREFGEIVIRHNSAYPVDFKKIALRNAELAREYLALRSRQQPLPQPASKRDIAKC
ncbi:MAG: hypothetical protein M1829_004403 [Trizodia sp. TS-e1964]|nr:MAG: hypothetical protein M1829_004403 [Trizodia sp. TS-e1964]